MTRKEFDRFTRFLKTHKDPQMAHFYMILHKEPEGEVAGPLFIDSDYKDVRVEGSGVYTSNRSGKGKTFTPREKIQRISLWVQPYKGPTVWF